MISKTIAILLNELSYQLTDFQLNILDSLLSMMEIGEIPENLDGTLKSLEHNRELVSKQLGELESQMPIGTVNDKEIAQYISDIKKRWDMVFTAIKELQEKRRVMLFDRKGITTVEENPVFSGLTGKHTYEA